ncbi:ASCH domain-containing protein [Flavobacteriaceae bacterium R38]|nr:ASCH domain-containing protein [Flavobacteriaceae bacterium R38]
MKNLSLILFLVFLSCKTEKKTESGSENITEKQIETVIRIKKSPSEMWEDFIASNPKFGNEEIPESDFFHNNQKDADRLAELTLTGKKKASSGLYSLYKKYNVDLPGIGTKQIVTDFEGNAKAIIENTSIDTIPFYKVSKEYAELDMGTDIEPLKKWRKAHWDFFESFLKVSGEYPTEEMLIVCIRFEKIWPKP